MNTSKRCRTTVSAIALLALISGACAQGPAEEAKARAVAPRRPERARWSWNQQPAKVTETGDLAWTPQPFGFVAGASVRYIDFEGGSDTGDGSRQNPWKHHPWDAAAEGNAKACRGVHTYVFKRGVTYRGTLVARESGEEGNPIRLTSDPDWGAGEAVLVGSERITGWKQGAEHADIPEGQKVWYVDLPFAPRSVWEERDGKAQRVPLARTPNWKVSDPNDVLSEWWTWQQPEWWTGKWQIEHEGRKVHMGVDAAHLTRDENYYKDAVVRTEYGICMGTPFPTRVEGFDPVRKGVIFQGIWLGDTEKIITKNRYYLEDKPHYLDSAGEFWFEKKGNGGRLYIRLEGDRDPNAGVVEAARRLQIIEDAASAEAPERMDILPVAALAKVSSAGVAHVEITGLSFRYVNTYWDLTLPGWWHQAVDNASIRLLGSTDNVRISNCSFTHVPKAIRIQTNTEPCRIDRVVVSDNDIAFTDHTAISITDKVGRAIAPPKSRMGDVKVLRNRLFEIGARTFRQDHDFALYVETPETCEIAGNVLERTYGAGIFVMRGKDLGGANVRDVPLARTLVYGNRVIDSLLTANDWGGIEVNGAGVAYVYNNISGGANGYWNWAYDPKRRSGGGLGMAFYLDGGGSKTEVFNNVAWGRTDDPTSKLASNCAFYEAGPNILNTYFNNTVYNVAMGSNWSPAGGRHLSLGNIWSGVGSYVWMHGKVKEDKDPAPAGEYPLHTDAYGRNVFERVTPEFAVFESAGRKHESVASMQAALAQKHAMAQDVGVAVQGPLFANGEAHDFRPRAGAVAQGAKVFVPWSLSRTVGEWHFRRNNADPSVLLDDHFYGAPYVTDRVRYAAQLLRPMKATNVKESDYVAGPLENWTAGALKLNGRDQWAALSHAEMTKAYEYEVGGKKLTASGEDLATADIGTGNLLIEVYFRTEPGHARGVLVSKLAEAGYRLAVSPGGGVALTVHGAGTRARLVAPVLVNDGQWHHVIAEIDRSAGKGRIYIDGNRSVEGDVSLPAGASLANSADLLVGRDGDGNYLAGTLEYLRIARGTLAEARTTIEELYDWEFDGPFLRDFAGREPKGGIRTAGAFEAAQ